ncbi:unnamed protein product, partial [Dibothriocephalus latus]
MNTPSINDSLDSGDASPSSHPLSEEVNRVCEERIDIFREFLRCDEDGLDCASKGWNVVAKQDNMTIYNREVESADGNYKDPLLDYKRIWPATQRDALFWSHMRHLDLKDVLGAQRKNPSDD